VSEASDPGRDAPTKELAPARRSRLVAAALTLLVCGLLAAYSALELRVTSDITHFLPDEQDAVTARLLRGLSTSSFGQRNVLTLGGASASELRAASAQLALELEGRPGIARVQWTVDAAAERAVYDLYFPHRYALYSRAPERQYAELTSDAGLTRAARQTLARLASPESALIRPLVPEDPLLAFPRVLERLEAARKGGLRMHDGAFFSADGKHAVLFVDSSVPALDATAQRAVLAQIHAAAARVRDKLGTRFQLEMSGVGRYAVHAERAIRRDIERISTVSTILIAALLLYALRSLGALALIALPTIVGVLAATAVTLALFGRVHGMTLAFGATLLGVCSDYPVHLLGHHMLGPMGRSPHATSRYVWPALRLGGLTTVAGMAALGLASFPGIRELACFSSVGVLASILATRFSVPWFLGPSGRAAARPRALAHSWSELATGLRARRGVSLSILLGALALCAAGALVARFQDDLAGWVPAPDGLRAEDARVARRLMAMDPGKLVVVSAATTEAALAANDRVAELLEAAVGRGELGGFASLHALVWSNGLQSRNLAALRAAPRLDVRTLEAFDRAGFDPSALAPFATGLQAPLAPLGLERVLASPLAPLARGFLLEGEPAPLILSPLRELRDRTALERALAAVPGARVVDQRSLLASTYAAFRTRALELLAAGLVLVLAMVLARYRALRPALAAVLPAVLAAFAALSVLALCGVPLDLFHVLGVLLVLSMGEDYGVFLVEHESGPELPATVLGIVLACLTTVFSFGLLALSDIPALRSLGQLVSIGVLLSLVFAPAGLVLLKRASER
jgi:predicted exporter